MVGSLELALQTESAKTGVTGTHSGIVVDYKGMVGQGK